MCVVHRIYNSSSMLSCSSSYSSSSLSPSSFSSMPLPSSSFDPTAHSRSRCFTILPASSLSIRPQSLSPSPSSAKPPSTGSISSSCATIGIVSKFRNLSPPVGLYFEESFCSSGIPLRLLPWSRAHWESCLIAEAEHIIHTWWSRSALRRWPSILILQSRRLRSTFPWCLSRSIRLWAYNYGILLISTTRCWRKSHHIQFLTYWCIPQSDFDIRLSISHNLSFSIPFSQISYVDNHLKLTSPTLQIWRLYFYPMLSSGFPLPLIFGMVFFAFLWPRTCLGSKATSTRISGTIWKPSACR